MIRTIDYFYSHVSPWTFLGHRRLIDIAARHGATIAFRPITVAEIFPKTGGLPLAKRPPERRAYRMVELKRWSKHLGVAINFEPKFFPADDRPALNLTHAAQAAGVDLADLSYAILKGVWQDERNVADWDELKTIADGLGLDGAALIDQAQTEEIQAAALAECEAALAAGCFGVPWYSLDGEGFWGQDRLDLLEVTLAGR
ncbi:MAG: 2-hydroxychromene-2-carboxylate isomerase [Alphaproteobacteria bacterium]|nr:2-hydroxychromene-2-carboxylate isomerase [Alphaproteobacteria bacterium]MBO6863130.1 2-hydroxychromene-2-carboxylate isomerase [Alphaproteobacteria bacterium]